MKTEKWRICAFKRNETEVKYDRLVTGFGKMCGLRDKWEKEEFLRVLVWPAKSYEIKGYRKWRK